MAKGFPRTLRRAAVDNALIDLLRESPWEQALRASQAAPQPDPNRGPDHDAHADTQAGR